MKKVRVFISGENNQNSSAVLSEFRQRLRSISDVEIVYTAQDADIELGILAFETHNEGTGWQNGYAVSVAIGTPCKAKLGTNEWNFRTGDDHILQVGGTNPAPIVARLVASIDDNFEAIRKSHAAYLKILREQKKTATTTN